MRYREIDLNLIVVFDALLRTASVSRAARSLGISQSAVSQSLAKLRKHFRDELFLKTRTGVAPTAIALSLAEDVRRFVDFSEAALTPRADYDPAAQSRTIRISMSEVGEITLAPMMLSAFRELAPKGRLKFLDLWGDELKEGLEHGDVDLAIKARWPPGGDVLQQKLYETSFVIVAHRGNNRPAEISYEEFSAAPHVAVSPGRLDHVSVDDDTGFGGVQRNVVAHVSNWSAVPHLIEAEQDLIAIMPRPLVAAYQHFGLKVLKPSFQMPAVMVFQYWHRRVNADPFNMWLRARMRELFARRLPEIGGPVMESLQPVIRAAD